jgi:SNF2 family DNA or RNA helicase
MQSEERAQLVGKKTSVAYVDLIYHDTIETKILEALRNKMSLSDAVTGDKWKAWVV